VTVSIQKFWIIVLVSNRIEYWSNYSIRFEISNIRTALVRSFFVLWRVLSLTPPGVYSFNACDFSKSESPIFMKITTGVEHFVPNFVHIIYPFIHRCLRCNKLFETTFKSLSIKRLPISPKENASCQSQSSTKITVVKIRDALICLF